MVAKYISKKRKRGRHQKRRRHSGHRLREWLWPSMGLLPYLRWFELHVKRQDETAYKAAMAVAIGVGVSFLPFLGMHTVFVLILAKLLRANFWIGMVATAFGNPWTFPLIFSWDLKFGQWLLGRQQTLEELPDLPPIAEFFEKLPLLWDAYLLPMTLGAIPSGVVVGLGFYIFTKKSIENYQKGRKTKIHKARERIVKRLKRRKKQVQS